jgi:ferredoxin-NADP reductase
LIVAPERIAWRLAAVDDVIVDTPRAKTPVLDVPGWPGHAAGQHVDVRLTAEDGYQAQRSYSIASAPEDATLALTVERLEDGEPCGALEHVDMRLLLSARSSDDVLYRDELARLAAVDGLTGAWLLEMPRA